MPEILEWISNTPQGCDSAQIPLGCLRAGEHWKVIHCYLIEISHSWDASFSPPIPRLGEFVIISLG